MCATQVRGETGKHDPIHMVGPWTSILLFSQQLFDDVELRWQLAVVRAWAYGDLRATARRCALARAYRVLAEAESGVAKQRPKMAA